MLHSDLSDFANSIVSGTDLAPESQAFCPHYPVRTALSVYQNNYRGNLQDTLAYAYPVIVELVGKDFFQYLTRHYIARHPSTSGNLHHYGSEMACFVACFEPAQSLIYLTDVAALEWACYRAYFADDATRLDVNRLSKILPENYPELVLHTDPACCLIRSRYPIATIWNAHQPGAGSDFYIDLTSGPSNSLIHRRNNSVIVSELAEAKAIWLQNILSGVSLGKATTATLECHPDFDLNAALLNLIEFEILTDFTLENSP